MNTNGEKATRRDFLKHAARAAVLLVLGGLGGVLIKRHQERRTVWQLDPTKCVQCGRCATQCVLNPSAVKCVHTFKMCGYCQLCTGFFNPQPNALNTGAENQLCPVGATRRRYVDDPYYEYTIDEPLCIGCGKCVKGCTTFGNGSLHLQVRHNLCLNCNECSIAMSCPAGAFKRVPADNCYLMKG